MVGKGTYWTKEEKARIVKEVQCCIIRCIQMEGCFHCRRYSCNGTWQITTEACLSREINEHKGIIGELTIENKTLKKSCYKERWEAMTELIANGNSKSRSASLTGIARSMIYYQRRKREPQYDADLERRISDIVTERPSYGTRRVIAMIRLSGSR
jgi:hypothetical protein